MKIILSTVITILLAGCSGPTIVPIKRSFPPVPVSLSGECPNLQTIPEHTDKLSEVLSTITTNYGHYHTCKLKVEAWNTWYTEQKHIFENIKND